MDEKLIAGYTAYTTADEYGTAATGEAPATTPQIGVVIASFGASVMTFEKVC
ncbi:LxmA leader domain family RiPP [Streptomyces sp. NPDC048506]|uniref:LxmA leader domain family RiPP n=1 Tax=Streptomyces sp. NPDC048506 TaxID=3155028 RepID=UPI003419DE39